MNTTHGSRRRVGLVLAVFIVLVGAGTTVAKAQSDNASENDLLSRLLHFGQTSDAQSDVTRVTVHGTSRLSVPPDKATIVLSVETRRSTATDALDENSAKVQDVIAGLENIGIPADSLDTLGFNVSPIQEELMVHPPVAEPPALEPAASPTPGISGFRAVNSVQVTLTDLGMVGRVIESAVGSGATGVSDLRFGLQDPGAQRKLAVADAVDAARLDAEALADSLGATVVRIAEVSSGDAGVVIEQAARAFGAGAPPIQPSDVTVSANVELVLEMSGATLTSSARSRTGGAPTASGTSAHDAAATEAASPTRSQPSPTSVGATASEIRVPTAPSGYPGGSAAATPGLNAPITAEAPTRPGAPEPTAVGTSDATVAAIATKVRSRQLARTPESGTPTAANPAPGPASPDVAFTSLLQGEDARYRSDMPRVTAVTSQTDYQIHLAPLLPADVQVSADWDTSFLVGVFLGQRARLGTQVTVERLERTGGELVAVVQVTEENAANAAVAVSSPYQLLRVDRSAVQGDPSHLTARLEELTGR